MRQKASKPANDGSVGVAYALLAYVAWGFLPIYWKLLDKVPAGEVLANRIFWSFVFVMGIIFVQGHWKTLKATMANRTNRLAMFACSIIISANWFIYIYAVHTDHLIEASLGYYIMPLFSVLLGMIFLKEKLNFWQSVAFVAASIGVCTITFQFGRVPWIALALTLTFGVYGLVKKLANVDSLTGLAMETAYVTPVALIYLSIVKGNQGTFLYAEWDLTTILLIGCGVATALPLLWFAQATRRVALATVGFVQYVSPTISLAIGVFLFHEPFTGAHLISFAFIWSAVIIYMLANTKLFIWLQSRIWGVFGKRLPIASQSDPSI